MDFFQIPRKFVLCLLSYTIFCHRVLGVPLVFLGNKNFISSFDTVLWVYIFCFYVFDHSRPYGIDE